MHLNADHVRDYRIYSYLNHDELGLLLSAMHARNISQKATAVRMFLLEHCQSVLQSSKSQGATQTANTTLYRPKSTVKLSFS